MSDIDKLLGTLGDEPLGSLDLHGLQKRVWVNSVRLLLTKVENGEATANDIRVLKDFLRDQNFQIDETDIEAVGSEVQEVLKANREKGVLGRVGNDG